MTYDNNTPLVNQQIATTQPLILGNFAFLDTGIGTEHNFNVSGTGSDMYHLKASMPNLSGGDPVALPAGTNGLYYVLGGLAKFYNTASGAQFIQTTPLAQQVLKGTAALTSASAATVVSVPTNSVGCYYIRPPLGTTNVPVAAGQFVSLGSTVQISGTFDPNMSLSTTGLTIKAILAHSADNGNYTYLIIYYVP